MCADIATNALNRTGVKITVYEAITRRRKHSNEVANTRNSNKKTKINNERLLNWQLNRANRKRATVKPATELSPALQISQLTISWTAKRTTVEAKVKSE